MNPMKTSLVVLLICTLFTGVSVGQILNPAAGILNGLFSGNIGATATWAAGVSGNIMNPLMFVGGVIPGPLTPNVVISSSGMFTVSVTSNLNIGGNLTIGGMNSNPSLNIANGVTMIVNGAINLISGTINLGTGSSLISIGGMNVTAITPTIINLGTNGVLSVSTLLVTQATGSVGLRSEFDFQERQVDAAAAVAVTAALTIVGSATATLNLLTSVVTVVDANLLLNVVVNVGVNTVLTTVGSAVVVVGGVLNVIGSVAVNLAANVVVLAGAVLNLNVALTLVSATLNVGATLVVNVVGSVVPVLNVVGNLVIAANLVLNVVGSLTATANIVVATALNVIGSINIMASVGVVVSTATQLAVGL